MKHEPLVLAYLAGMIDADGYITIHRSQRGTHVYHAPQIGIAGTRREPHDLAASLWGGTVGFYQPRIEGHLGQFQWSRQGAAAVKPIEDIYPYLRIKVKQADLALEVWSHAEDGRHTKHDPYPWFGPHYDPVEARDEMRADMISINQSRSRLRKSSAGRLLDGREHNGMPPMTVTDSPHGSPSRKKKTSDIPVHGIGETE